MSGSSPGTERGPLPARISARIAAWDRRFAEVAGRPSTAGVAEQLLELAAQLEQLRQVDGDACDLRWQRLAQLAAVHGLGVQDAVHQCLRWLVVLLSVILPSSLVAAVYGMNFAPHSSPWAMPELFFYWGYPAVLVIMAGLMVLALLALRRARGLTLPGAPSSRAPGTAESSR